ncbi:MAG: hypothetical protein K1X74_16655 [Pirellulales bacterium]|nr:hypothetical protein [Pirellulales bacterium]
MIGPAVPRPVPSDVIEALRRVEVTSSERGPDAFRLEFSIGPRSPLQSLFLLSGGAPIPAIRVMLMVTLNGSPQVLIDGFMTDHQMQPEADGRSTLVVTGEDLTVIMGYKQFSGLPFPAMPSFLRVSFILAKYAALGIQPRVVPTLSSIFPNPLDKIPRQEGTDLEYIRLLAERAGYVFYLEPGNSPGSSIAYWGPAVRSGAPQPPLSANHDADTNVESIRFSFNNERKVMPVAWVQEPFSKMTLPVPLGDINPLSPRLGQLIPVPKQVRALRETAKFSLVEAAELALAAASKTSQVVTAQGSLDVLRYGRILAARRLVSVRGAGNAYNGLYYVERVTHRIASGEYKQDFELSRNGLVTTVNRVSA